MVSYLPEEYKVQFRGNLQRAYLEPDYETEKSRLMAIHQELKMLNHTAANSLLEGLEETLTIEKLGIREELGRSLSTTKIIESANSRLSDQMRNVKRWYNSSKMANWIGINLLEIEKRMNRIKNYTKLKLLEFSLINYVRKNCEVD